MKIVAYLFVLILECLFSFYQTYWRDIPNNWIPYLGLQSSTLTSYALFLLFLPQKIAAKATFHFQGTLCSQIGLCLVKSLVLEEDRLGVHLIKCLLVSSFLFLFLLCFLLCVILGLSIFWTRLCKGRNFVTFPIPLLTFVGTIVVICT